MEEKKLTDEEIIKALECCINDKCSEECPYRGKRYDCVYQHRHEKDLLDLIHRLQSEKAELVKENCNQKAEIERMTEEANDTVSMNEMYIKEVEKNAELQKQNKQLANDYQDIGILLDQECDKTELLQKQVKEYQDKIEQGTLIELPCKVGDTVYYTSPEYYNSLLVEYKVTEISQTREGIRLAVYGSPKEKGLITYLWASFIGKTVFLTRKEAEKRLKELKE